MARLDQLLSSYRRHVGQRLKTGLPLSQRIWFVVYPPEEERRLQLRTGDFEFATKEATLVWQELNLAGLYAEWIESFDAEERDICLSTPSILESYTEGFLELIKRKIESQIATVPADLQPTTIFALTGIMELFDFVHVSDVVGALDKSFPGVLLVFFPGEREGNTYRFLGARDGWDYLAIPILAEHDH